jgi:hypothetical protein
VADLELYSPVFVVTGDTEAERASMEQAVRRQIAFYASTPSYAAVLEFHGFGDLQKQMGGLMREGKLDEMGAHVPDALLNEIVVFAPSATLGQTLRARYDGVLDRVSLYSTMGGEGSFSRWPELVAGIHAA